MSESADQSHPAIWTAAVLGALGGFVDAFAYLALTHVLVAHLSGDTATMAVHAARGEFGAALHRMLPIPGFVLGALLGRVASDTARALRIRRRLSVVLLCEVALLGAFAAFKSAAPSAALLCVAASMGVQNAALRHVAGHELRTTFVTGMVVSFADELVNVVRRDCQRKPFLFLHAAVWTTFALGAACGAVAWLRWGAPAIAIAMFVILAIIGVDLVRPVAPQS